MNESGQVSADFAGEIAEQWLSAACSVTEWYLGLFDPRPDLSIPARSVTLLYKWWW